MLSCEFSVEHVSEVRSISSEHSCDPRREYAGQNAMKIGGGLVLPAVGSLLFLFWRHERQRGFRAPVVPENTETRWALEPSQVEA